MQKLNFYVAPKLLERIDEAIEKWGFQSRAEFFRCAAINFIRGDAQSMPADIVLREHAKAINSVHAEKNLAEARKDWYNGRRKKKV